MQFANHYADLPPRFHAPVEPTPVASPRLVALNAPLARQLGLDADWLRHEDGVAMLAGNAFPAGMRPVATAYAGHQFGQFVPQLGDGRALLLGDVRDIAGRPYEIQLKGSGPTVFSRRGDGRAALGPVLREYLLSEAMAALGVPTTRALAAVTTGERVMRETMLPGAVLARVARSHIRVGTFQFLAARGDVEGLRVLTDYAIARHYPQAADAECPALSFFDSVVGAQAALVAQWMGLGFIHGVMNTDNCAVSGETIDYGPAAFLDDYDPGKVFSSIDQGGRYAYANQPRIAMWNLARLAETLLPLVHAEAEAAASQLQPVLGSFVARYEAAFGAVMRRKLGLTTQQEGDDALISGLLDLLAKGSADYTRAFRSLADEAPGDLLALPGFEAWRQAWRARVAREPGEETLRARIRAANPAVIPRNHQVEAVIAAAVQGDFAPFAAMLAAVTKPFDDDAAFERAPEPGERVYATFCGT